MQGHERLKQYYFLPFRGNCIQQVLTMGVSHDFHIFHAIHESSLRQILKTALMINTLSGICKLSLIIKKTWFKVLKLNLRL